MWSTLTIATLPTQSEAVALDIPLPDANALLPVAILCIASILCTAIWLVTVSSYTTKQHKTMA
jgi:hypothetical protein